MTLWRRPPAGRPVPWSTFSPTATGRPAKHWQDLPAIGVGSGTEALALALRTVMSSDAHAAWRVILPAYACPNLVAATRWAGAEPLYAEVTEQTLTTDPAAIESVGTAERTVLLVVDAFGIDGAASTASLFDRFAGPVVHDLAQSFLPMDPHWRPRAAFNVLSFGRAKPMGLGAGGALVCREHVPATATYGAAVLGANDRRLRALAYNVALWPPAFTVLSRLPVLEIGATRYEPLHDVKVADDGLLLSAQTLAEGMYRRRDELLAETQSVLALAQEAGAFVPPAAIASSRNTPLWRVPALMKSPSAARRALERAAHLGITGMYRRTLPEFLDVSADEAEQRWPAAFSIARRLITLPSNGTLDARARDELRRVLIDAADK